MNKKKSEYEGIRHKLETDMLQASSLRTEIERRGFVNRTFTSLHKAYQEKRIQHNEYIRLINRLAAYSNGQFNDYIDMLAGAAQMGMLDLAIQGELSQLTPEASRQRRDQVNELTGTRPVEPEPESEESTPLMARYERTIRSNMASAERDYKNDSEHRRGFTIGAVLKLWEVYQQKQIDESQFDKLISVLCGYSNGEYRDFINEQVRQYKSGHPPTIIGY